MLIPEIHSRCREHYLSLLCIFKLYMYSFFSMYLPRNSWFSVSLKFQTKKSSFDVRISLYKYCKYFKNVPKFFAQIAVELNRMTSYTSLLRPLVFQSGKIIVFYQNTAKSFLFMTRMGFSSFVVKINQPNLVSLICFSIQIE